MQVILDHFNGMIRTALRTYLATERELDVANEAGDIDTIREAKERVNLAARQAVDLLHHFADFVFKEPDPALPAFKNPGDVRNTIRPLCVFTRTTMPVDDVSLLMGCRRLQASPAPARLAPCRCAELNWCARHPNQW
jgi:hypothetical protein